jgi:hypothetical protein
MYVCTISTPFIVVVVCMYVQESPVCIFYPMVWYIHMVLTAILCTDRINNCICPKYLHRHHRRLRQSTHTTIVTPPAGPPARYQGPDARPPTCRGDDVVRRALLAPLCDARTTEAVILANTRTQLKCPCTLWSTTPQLPPTSEERKSLPDVQYLCKVLEKCYYVNTKVWPGAL